MIWLGWQLFRRRRSCRRHFRQSPASRLMAVPRMAEDLGFIKTAGQREITPWRKWAAFGQRITLQEPT